MENQHVLLLHLPWRRPLLDAAHHRRTRGDELRFCVLGACSLRASKAGCLRKEPEQRFARSGPCGGFAKHKRCNWPPRGQGERSRASVGLMLGQGGCKLWCWHAPLWADLVQFWTGRCSKRGRRTRCAKRWRRCCHAAALSFSTSPVRVRRRFAHMLLAGDPRLTAQRRSSGDAILWTQARRRRTASAEALEHLRNSEQRLCVGTGDQA